MTAIDTANETDIWAARLAQERQHAALANETWIFNKPMLFVALERAGVHCVIVSFDGAGDSGQIHAIEASDTTSASASLPDDAIEALALADDLSGLVATSSTARELIEAMVYDSLERTHGGWQNDDGAWGEFHFDVPARAVRLEYNERHLESDFYEHVF